MSNINNELKSIFIHIPKCAGTSMSSYKWNLGSGHKTIFEYYKDSINLKNYFKWCFVRNPWERIASAYEDCPEIFQVAPTFNKFIETIDSNRNKIPKNHISTFLGIKKDSSTLYIIPVCSIQIELRVESLF